MNIIDKNSLLSQLQIDLLQQHAKDYFQLGRYNSLDDILTKLKVNVIIEPGIPKRYMPVNFDFEAAIEYWRKEANILESQIREDQSKREDYNNAKRNIEEISREKEIWSQMPLRGLYDPIDNVIKLFPEEMNQEYNGTRMDELLVSTLAHETMHAYFNRPRHNRFPYVLFVEEPLAEFGMLLYLIDIHSSFFNWAYGDVRSKRTCYRYGADFLDQYASGYSLLRKYLEDYKININPFAIPITRDCNGNIICDSNGNMIFSLPQKVGSNSVTVNINNRSITSTWKDVFKCPPRYFYDSATKTLGLDGEWGGFKRLRHMRIYEIYGDVYLGFHVVNVDNLYLGDNFYAEESFHDFSRVNFIVSPKNRTFYAKNGIPVYKHNNEPFLSSCGNGYYELCRNDKWGVIDSRLNTIIPFNYDRILYFDKNNFMVEKNGQYGLVNLQGEVQIPVIYDDISENNDGTYTVKQRGKEFKIDKSGNKVP